MAETTLQSPPPPLDYQPSPPKRPKRSFAWRLGKSARNWARNTFSRDQLINALKSLAWVVPMTVLIWVYAEREQITNQKVVFHVEPRNADPNFVVELTPGSDGRPRTDIEVHADLSGSQARLQRVREKLDSAALQKEIDSTLGGGLHAISLSDLKDNPLFKENGVVVSNISPPELTVKIDHIEHREVPVTVRPNVTNLDGPAIFEPARVYVSAPKFVLDAASAQGKLLVYAELGNLDEPGIKNLANVALAIPFSDPHLTISPTTVSAHFTVKKSDVEGVVNSMPVWAIYPPLPIWDKYKVEYDSNLANVKVSGPADKIDKINDPAHEPRPKAIFYVTLPVGGNIVGTRQQAKLQFDFGNPDLKCTEDGKTIEFTLVERKPE